MIREKVRLKIYRLDEETMQREEDFPYTEEDRTDIELDIERLLHGQHIIADDGRVFYVGVVSVKDDN